MGDEKQKSILDENGPTKQFHTFEHSESESEKDKREERYIREKIPFKGNWSTIIQNDLLYIPTDYHVFLAEGGVITTDLEQNLLLFGRKHWDRFERQMTDNMGWEPKRRSIGRHFYKHMLEFDSLNEDGSIKLSKPLIRWAVLHKDIAIVGMIYFAEIYALEDYKDTSMTPADIKGLMKALSK